jgi:hypothetical protein
MAGLLIAGHFNGSLSVFQLTSIFRFIIVYLLLSGIGGWWNRIIHTSKLYLDMCSFSVLNNVGTLVYPF